jgi:hypothetical protein
VKARAPGGVYFVHIPKTAGTSFRWMLEAQYPAARCCQVYPALPGLVFHVPGAYPPIDAGTANRIDCFSSHAPLGTFPALERRLATITLLREPVSRELSLFAYSLPRAGRRRQDLEGLTLPQYIDLMRERHQDNMHVRMLSGAGFAGDLDEAALSAARSHLRERITAFGLTERFTDSMIVFARLFGWRSMRLVTRNVTPRPATAALPETLRQRLAEMNRYDTLLYEDARALFDERLRRSPISDTERRGVREAAGLERVMVYQQRLMRRLLRVRVPRS